MQRRALCTAMATVCGPGGANRYAASWGGVGSHETTEGDGAKKRGSHYVDKRRRTIRVAAARGKSGKGLQRTKGRKRKVIKKVRKRERERERERRNETFYKLIAFTHGTHISFLFLVSIRYTKSERGAVWQFVSARKVQAPVYAVQYYTKTCGYGQAEACGGFPASPMPTTFETSAQISLPRGRAGCQCATFCTHWRGIEFLSQLATERPIWL